MDTGETLPLAQALNLPLTEPVHPHLLQQLSTAVAQQFMQTHLHLVDTGEQAGQVCTHQQAMLRMITGKPGVSTLGHPSGRRTLSKTFPATPTNHPPPPLPPPNRVFFLEDTLWSCDAYGKKPRDMGKKFHACNRH